MLPTGNIHSTLEPTYATPTDAMFRVKVYRGAPLRSTHIALRLRLDRPLENKSASATPGRHPATPDHVASTPSWQESPPSSPGITETETIRPGTGRSETVESEPAGDHRPTIEEAAGPGETVGSEESSSGDQKDSESIEKTAAGKTTAPKGIFGASSGSRKRLRFPRDTGERQPPKTLPARPCSFSKLVALVLCSAALSAALTAGLLMSSSRNRLGDATEPESRLQLSITHRDNEARRLELDRKSRTIAGEYEVVSGAMQDLLAANLRLETQQELSVDRAVELDEKLAVFIEKHRQLAAAPNLSPDRRDAIQALVDQGQRYRQALESILKDLELEKSDAARRAEDLETRLQTWEIRGRKVRVIHDPTRIDDARRVVEILQGAGAQATLFPAEIAEPGIHHGRLFYHRPQEEEAARAIARLVAEVEFVQPQAVGLAQPFLCLWIVADAP